MLLKHGSLFSGIGGFDLAAEWMGWENSFHCEWNEFGQRVLKYYWPKAISYGDITKTDFTIWRGLIDVLSGGFPCQPYSTAGKRLGKDDERHLWPEMLRAIREIQPRWIVGENVLGLVNWNGGLVFEELQADLEAQGYKVQPFVLPACAVNAPHRRDRVWFVAFRKDAGTTWRNRFTGDDGGRSSERRVHAGSGHSNDGSKTERAIANSDGSRKNSSRKHNAEDGREKAQGTRTENDTAIFVGSCSKRNATDTNSIIGCKRRMHEAKPEKTERHAGTFNAWINGGAWQNFPTVSPLCDGNDGLSDRLDGITFSKWRQESIKAGGNAVVPQVVYQIFKAIEQYELTQH